MQRTSHRRRPAPSTSVLDVTPATIDAALGELYDETDLVDSLHRAETLRWFACRMEPASQVVPQLGAAIDAGHDVVALAALHALSSVPADDAATALAVRLDDPRGFIREHAAWALSARAPLTAAVPALLGMVGRGGFAAMLAQRTLAGWSCNPSVAALIVGHAGRHEDVVPLIDLVGLVDGADATGLLERVARHGGRPGWSAAAALGPRDGASDTLSSLARRDDEVGAAARLAVLDRSLRARPPVTTPSTAGLRVAQVVLHADLAVDEDVAGRGDNGGLATLVRQLGDAFALRGDVGAVTTLSRGGVDQAIGDVLTAASASRRFASIAVAAPAHLDRRSGWSERITIERGIHRALTAGPLPHVLHLRMADVGTLAAQRVARQLGVPVVFTAAPDPHQPLRLATARGELDPATFGPADEREHHWFRARLVERMTLDATAIVTLPRRDGTTSIGSMLGGEAGERARQAPAIGEGIDPSVIRAARRRAVSSASEPVVDRLRRLLAPTRRGRPVLVSVGRLHPAKGMATLARAWRDDAVLATTTNLVIVGGDLDDPSPDEGDVIADLTALLGDDAERAERGAVLTGHLSPPQVAQILTAAHLGADPVVAPGGVYVAAAPKEEFGLAIVEALAAGLPVVAPDVGGPATYLTDGDTGILVDTGSAAALAAAIHRARALVDRPGRVGRADELVDTRLSVDAMAEHLVEVYRSVRVPA